jgi:hypothetical protein
MSLIVAEYLGQRTDAAKLIVPVAPSERPRCPFMNSVCTKVAQGTNPTKPVCSVRNTAGELWIVCRHRLCASVRGTPLSKYQKDILSSVANAIYDSPNLSEVQVRPEVTLGTYGARADFLMVNFGAHTGPGPRSVVLEMQGGGETSNTGTITRHVAKWESSKAPSNEMLRSPLTGPGTIVTNAWRRQQEQFLIKGNIAVFSGGAIVFCVGRLLYDLLMRKVEGMGVPNMRGAAWNLAVVCFEEVPMKPVDGSIPIAPNAQEIFFTHYHEFTRALLSQGGAIQGLFDLNAEFMPLA